MKDQKTKSDAKEGKDQIIGLIDKSAKPLPPAVQHIDEMPSTLGYALKDLVLNQSDVDISGSGSSFQTTTAKPASKEELPSSDLPTYRDVIAYFQLLQDQGLDRKDVCKKTYNELTAIWSKACPDTPRLNSRSIWFRLSKLYASWKQFKRKRLLKWERRTLLDSLDKLFNMSYCTCALHEVNCDSLKCEKVKCSERHLQCVCKIEDEKKIPCGERLYMKNQKARAESKRSSDQLSTPEVMLIGEIFITLIYIVFLMKKSCATWAGTNSTTAAASSSGRTGRRASWPRPTCRSRSPTSGTGAMSRWCP